MDLPLILQMLRENAGAIALLARLLAADQWRWKPDAQSWSALELICHLRDEEREDFRTHLENALLHPEKPWAPIDPAGWVSARGYNLQDPAESLRGFLDARAESLEWLKTLQDPDWERAVEAPWGSIRAGDLLASWAAHDLHAVRQLTELHHAWLARQSAPYRLEYAGDW